MIFFEGVAAKSLPDSATSRTGAIYKSLSFHLGEGCHAIGGPSTDPQAARLLLELAAGLERPSRGNVRVLSHPAGSARVVADVAYVPRDVLLPDSLTALEVVRLDAAVRGRQKTAAEPMARLQSLNLEGFAKRKVHTLSLPERRGIAMAIAVTSGAKVLLVEEPFVDLCGPAVGSLAGAVRGFAAVKDRCVLVATASRRDASSLGAAVQGLVNERLVPAGYGVSGEASVLHVVLSDPMKLAAAFAQEGAAHTIFATATSVEIHTDDLHAAANTVARAAVAESLSIVSMYATGGAMIAGEPDRLLGEAARTLSSLAPPPLEPAASEPVRAVDASEGGAR